MTPTARGTSGLLIAALVCAVGAAVLAALPVPGGQHVTVDVDLGAVVPGEPVTSTVNVDVPTDSTVVRAEWVHLDGIARHIDWSVALCGGDGCADGAPVRTGAVVPAGTHTVCVTGVLAGDSPAGSGQATGVVSLVSEADAGALEACLDSEAADAGGAPPRVVGAQAGSASGGVPPWTGDQTPWAAAVLAVAAVACGLTALVRERRRRVDA
ncbi:hypothetical protein [Demequina globuliformis]|uniref:hypothetical protein n=1 Tax=Demequina globuliformis TaxID=676202 RepID=UPI0007821FA9|nr:hypothetical protein [Demequina globuliformis]